MNYMTLKKKILNRGHVIFADWMPTAKTAKIRLPRKKPGIQYRIFAWLCFFSNKLIINFYNALHEPKGYTPQFHCQNGHSERKKST